MVLTLFGMSVLIFVMLRLVPGNIADILVDSAGIADPKEKAKIAAELGLDRPIFDQYLQWIGGLVRGDLGFAYVSERPALEEIAPRIPISAKLAGLALFFSVILGAVRQNSAIDYLLRLISLSGLSLPSFWLGLLILMASVQWFGMIPIYTNEPRSFIDEMLLLSIPAAAVGFRSSALIMRLTRSSMLEVLRQDYIRTARSKGASQTTVNYVHALRNALLPVVTIIGIEAAFLVGGLIVTETVFNIPGVARFLVEAILWRDYPIVQNLVMLIAFCVVVVNFLVDMAYMALDPRIKYAD
jgi:peptide/nickel transport system permease protein